MNDKTIVAFCVTVIACISLFVFKEQATTIASSTITGFARHGEWAGMEINFMV